MEVKRPEREHNIDYILTQIMKVVSVINKFKIDSDHILLREKVETNTRLERNKLIRLKRFSTNEELIRNITQYQIQLSKILTLLYANHLEK